MIKSLKGKEYKEMSKREVVNILLSYLEDQRELLIREMSNNDSFDLPSWSEYQAYKLGSLKTLTKVVDFLPDQGQDD